MRRAAIMLVLLLAFSSSVQAQSGGYILGPGDVIEIVVLDQPDLTQTSVIGPDGFVALQLIGRVKAAGRTTEQLAAELVARYQRYLRAPVVTVRVKEFRVERIYIMGQVGRPGEYQLQQGVGLISLIATAGGLTPKADARRITVMRGAQSIVVDMDQVLLRESQGQLTALRPGDIIFVPEIDRRVTVLGQLNRPGAYEFQEGQRVSDALALAGGLTPLAALRKATLTRGSQTIPIDLEQILKTGNPEANPVLQPGDLIIVPEESSRVAVLGFVTRPGAYAIKDGDRVLDAVVMAGGNAERGDLGNVSLVRQAGGAQPQVIRLDLRKAVRGDTTQNVPLQDRDVVYVAEVGSLDAQKVVPWGTLIVTILRLLFGVGF